jgi:squalene synthase HpnC
LDPSFSRAYATCFDVARRHYENFPVASWLLPSEIRPHVAAVYAFARYADDFADEGDRAPSERLTLLDDWLRRFHVAVNGEVNPDSDQSVDLVFAAVNHTMTRYDLPASLFEDLISAFRQDVTVDRYESWETLLDYCRRSANPVGRLVLRIAGRREEALERASDCLCSALQIANFLQDFDCDWQRGRLYIPSEVSRNFSASESELDDDQLSPAWRATIADVARRNRQLFDLGRSICDEVGGRLGLELRFTWLGGCRILDQLKSGDYDPRMRRPKLGAGDFLPILWKAANWQRLS